MAGKTYILENGHNPKFPLSISFSYYDNEVSYGSAILGNPGGKFSYRGNCHGGVNIYFTSNVDQSKREIFMVLQHQDVHYFRLTDTRTDDIYVFQTE